MAGHFRITPDLLDVAASKNSQDHLHVIVRTDTPLQTSLLCYIMSYASCQSLPLVQAKVFMLMMYSDYYGILFLMSK